MGALSAKLVKHARRFNVENRATKAITMEKPRPAPRHPTDLKQMDEIMSDKSTLASLAAKDPNLDDRLRHVFVTSRDPIRKFGKPSERARADNLPKDRRFRVENVPGADDVENVTPGKITLLKAMRMLVERQEAPDKFTSKIAADKYKLSEKDADLILEYYVAFDVFMPENTKEETTANKILRAFMRPTKPIDVKVEVKKLN